jgi:hypothetical protein
MAPTVDVASKEGREKCWESRDIYWKCLTDYKENEKKCKKQRDLYENNCTQSWVCLAFIHLKSKIL